jgi:hypothetical protein
MVAFRGWVGPVSVWEKPFAAHEVTSMYWNNLATNIFHPYFGLQPYSSELPEADTTASVWTLGREDKDSLAEKAEAIRRFVQTGGSLYVPISDANTVSHLNAVFGWNVLCSGAPTANIVTDPNNPAKQERKVIPAHPAPVRDLPSFLADISKAPRMSDDENLAVDVASLPPNATELYTASIVQAFTTAVGDGRVSYIGFQGHGRATTPTADQNAWKTILVRLMRGQRQLDI